MDLLLDYGDIIYNKAFIGSFQQKLESIQYNAALVITEGVTITFREKIYSELSLEYYKIDVGRENYVIFIKYYVVYHRNTCLIYYSKYY